MAPQDFVNALYEPLQPEVGKIAKFYRDYQQFTEPLQKAVADKDRAQKWGEILGALVAYKQFIENSAQDPALQLYAQTMAQTAGQLIEGFKALYDADMIQLTHTHYQLSQGVQGITSLIAASEQAKQQYNLW